MNQKHIWTIPFSSVNYFPDIQGKQLHKLRNNEMLVIERLRNQTPTKRIIIIKEETINKI